MPKLESVKPTATEHVEEADHLRSELAKERYQKAQLLLARAEDDLKRLNATLGAKYKMGEGDAYDPATLEIKRAPKPESPK